MLSLASGARVHLALMPVDMRKGFDGLSMLVQQVLKRDPFGGHVFVFRGKRSHLIKILVWEDRLVLVRQTAGEGPLRMAGDTGGRGHPYPGAAFDAAGRHRLALAAAHRATLAGRLRCFA